MLSRRWFLSVVGALAASFVVEAQTSDRIYRLGFLGQTSAQDLTRQIAALRQGLRDRGYEEGRNLVIDSRWAERKLDRLPALASELVGLKVDIIVTHGSAGSRAAKHATDSIPIVIAVVGDPVASGVVASLARPGGNVTGVTNNPGPGFIGKQLETLREAAPKLSRVAVLWDSSFQKDAPQEIRSAARALDLAVVFSDVREPKQFTAAFATTTRERASALLVLPTSQNNANAARIVEFAKANRLLTMFGDRRSVEAGGLMSYWTDWGDLRRRAAHYVDKILKGTRPADLPVEEPAKFELVVNLKTAKALGLTIPQSLLLRADQVIE